MADWTEQIHELLGQTTAVLRKGEVIKENAAPEGVRSISIDLFPGRDEVELPEQAEVVDCHFVEVAVLAGDKDREALVELLRAYPAPERLAGGPSYIEVGAVLGDQTAAFRLFALGKATGLWSVVTPAALGIEGPQGDELAGRGYVMCTGWKETEDG